MRIFWQCVFLAIPLLGFSQSYQTSFNTFKSGGCGYTSTLNTNEEYRYSQTVNLGEPFIGEIVVDKELHGTIGQFSFYHRKVADLKLEVSEGDYPDRIHLVWRVDALQPSISKGVKIFRNDEFIIELARGINDWSDRNVIPGQLYEYKVYPKNTYGIGIPAGGTGFVNPNGMITGKVVSIHQRPVANVELGLTPYLGHSLNLNGNGEYVEVPTIPDSLFENSYFTIEFWCKIKNYAGADGYPGMIIQKWNGSDGQDNAFAIYSNGRFASQHKISPEIEIPLNEWHHLAYSLDKGTLTVYLDSVQVVKETGHSSSACTAPFRIGNLWNNSNNFEGLLDEVRVWNHNLDSAKIVENLFRVVSPSSEGLIANWRFDEGSGAKLFDLTDNSFDGYRNGCSFSDENPGIHNTAFTDEYGNYRISGIFYYPNGTTFTVTPRKPYHSFVPLNRQITLSTSSTASDQVDFTDDSQITFSGYISFSGTSCFEEEVEIMELITMPGGEYDTVSFSPRVLSDENGRYVCEFEPGTEHTIVAIMENHELFPLRYETGVMNVPLAQKNFIDETKYNLSGRISGGTCEYALGKVFRVAISTQNGCYSDTVITDPAGYFQFDRIPASKYLVQVIHDYPEFEFEGQEADLLDGNDTILFNYRAPMEVEILGIPVSACAEKVYVVSQGKPYHLTLTAFERYNQQKCYLNNIEFRIINGIGDQTDPVYLDFQDTAFNPENPEVYQLFELIPGVPNILAGGERPYQKSFEILGRDENGREASTIIWAIVEGHKPRTQTFASRIPNFPFLILHDPPGDMSYSEINTETTSTTTTTSYVSLDEHGKVKLKMKIGTKSLFGFGAMTESKFNHTIQRTLSVEAKQNWNDQMEFSVSSGDAFRTGSSEYVTGSHGDVYIGGALNVTYGLTDVLNLEDCLVKLSTSICISPDGFSTTYVYAESHILSTVIPALYQIEDTLSAHQWESIIAANQANKERASFLKNVSFTAGETIEHFDQTTKSDISSFSTSMKIDNSVALGVEMEVAGAGFSGEVTAGITVEFGESEIDKEINTTKIKYVLGDNDAGNVSDYFSVDVLTDPVFGTPVFHLKGGASRCPWEEGTQKRENVSIAIEPGGDVYHVSPEKSAVYQLTVGNTSETNEEWQYYLRLINASNPHGAIVKFDGQILASAVIPLIIHPGHQETYTLTLDRGPVEYEYDNLKVMLYSACEYSYHEQTGFPLQIADTAIFSAHFIKPCANDIRIYEPVEEWMVNQSDTALMVSIAGYVYEDPSLDFLLMEYANLETSVWVVADTIPKDSLTNPFYRYSWNVTDVGTGFYGIRVVNVCRDGTRSESNETFGLIDRYPPALLEKIKPVDGVLNPDDQVMLVFNESISNEKLTPNLIHLYNISTGLDVPFTYECADNQINIFIDVQNRYIENCALKLTIDEIWDLHENKADLPIEFEFLVDRNPVHWNQNYLNVTTFFGTDTTLKTSLHNTGAKDLVYRFNSKPWLPMRLDFPLPDYLRIIPETGDLNAGGTEEVLISISGIRNAGYHQDTIFMHTSEGDDFLVLNNRVLCQPPVWQCNPNNYRYNMSLVTELSVFGELSTDIQDRIGVFCGHECRGQADIFLDLSLGEPRDSSWTDEFGIRHTITVVDTLSRKYLGYVNVYSNKTNGEVFYFRVWDASSCEEFWQSDQEFQFSADGVLGSYENPYLVVATGQIGQDIQLHNGWNWFSTWVDNRDSSRLINNVISHEGHFSETDRIIHQDKFETFSISHDSWLPGELLLEPATMYMAYLEEETQICLTGNELDIDSVVINIDPGWNWLGYPSRRSGAIDKVLSDAIFPDQTIIKTEETFSQFEMNLKRWKGSMNYFEPGQGYMLFLPGDDPVSFRFKPDIELKAESKPIHPVGLQSTPFPYHQFRYNMPFFVKIDNQSISEKDVKILALINGEIRGISHWFHENLHYLMVHSSLAVNDVISFAIKETETGHVYQTKELAVFNALGVGGSVRNPFTLSLKDNVTPAINVYPNPSDYLVNIDLLLPETQFGPYRMQIDILNPLMQIVEQVYTGDAEAGLHHFTWQAHQRSKSNASSCLYFLRAVINDQTTITKILIQ
jgi:hypothetical protein